MLIKERISLRGKGYSFFISFLFITITALIIYSNTFYFPFQFDDATGIVENSRIRNLSNFLNLSGTRYIGEFSFALNYYFDQLNVFSYRMVNIIIHIVNGILVWWFVILTLKTPMMNRSTISPKLISFIALTSSLIFISHPIQTQAITYIVQRFASLATLFYLLSIILFVKWRLSPVYRFKNVFYLFSILSAVLAMKTKEISFTLPFIIILYEFTFFRNRKGRPYFLIPFLFTLSIIPLTIIGIDKPIGNVIGEISEASQETETISRNVYLLTQFRVIVTYIRLLFLPINQNLDYDYLSYNSLFQIEVFLSFLFLLSIFSLTVYLFIRSLKAGNNDTLLTSFGIFWFFITLSVESSIIPIKDLIFEHRLYLPGIGAVIAFSSAALYSYEYTKKRFGFKIAPFLFTGIFLFVTVGPLSFATYQRNLVWKDEITLWEDVVRKSPGKARGYNNLGLAYFRQGRVDKAAEKYRTALKLEPDFVKAHYNLGIIYAKLGMRDMAFNEFKKVLEIIPSDYMSRVNLGFKAHNNIGMIYWEKGNIEMAIMEFKRALSINPGYARAHLNLGKIYMQEGDSELSYKELKMAMNLALSAGQKELALSVQQEIDRLSKRSESRLFPLIDEE